MYHKVFISYSRTSPRTQKWVKQFVERLRNDGVEVDIDFDNLKEGDDMHHFMESMIKNNERILTILDESYKEKADSREGGVGVEVRLLAPLVGNKSKQVKVIPIIVEKDEEGEPYLPRFLESILCSDLSEDNSFDENYNRLLSCIKKEEVNENKMLVSDTETKIIKKKHNKATPSKISEFEFEEKREFTNRESIHTSNCYWNAKKSVCINAFMPSNYDETGSCVIEFIKYPTMISLVHSEILELCLKHEEYGIKNIISRGKLENQKKIFVTIGTNALNIDESIFEEFVEIFGDFLDTYLFYYRRFEKFVEVDDFERSEDDDYNSYSLGKITTDEWKLLKEHSKKYDMDNGTTDEYFFNYTHGRHITALDREHITIKFQIYAEQIKRYDDFTKPDNLLKVMWKVPDAEDRIKMKEGHVWKATETRNWITETLNSYRK